MTATANPAVDRDAEAKPIWTVETKDQVYVVAAEDQWGAFDHLRYLGPEKFGLLVVAKRQFGKDGDEIAVRTSMLFGKRWGRPDIAHMFIARAIEEGLPDTTAQDCLTRRSLGDSYDR